MRTVILPIYCHADLLIRSELRTARWPATTLVMRKRSQTDAMPILRDEVATDWTHEAGK
jgi:hypothetical protein